MPARQPVDFVPTQLGSMILWLRATDSLFPQNGTAGTITKWADKSGQGNDLATLTGTPQTVLKPGQGSFPTPYAASFAGSQALSGANPVAWGGAGATIVVVYSITTYTVGGCALIGPTGGSTVLDIEITTQGRVTGDAGNAGIGGAATQVPAALGTWHIATLVANAANSAMRPDGQPTYGSTAGGANAAVAGISLGHFSFKGLIAEVRVWDRPLSLDEIHWNEADLAASYNLNVMAG